jgi:hypothetical protein
MSLVSKLKNVGLDLRLGPDDKLIIKGQLDSSRHKLIKAAARPLVRCGACGPSLPSGLRIVVTVWVRAGLSPGTAMPGSGRISSTHVKVIGHPNKLQNSSMV